MIEVQSLTKRFGGNMFGIRSGNGTLGVSDAAVAAWDANQPKTQPAAPAAPPAAPADKPAAKLATHPARRPRFAGAGGFLALQDISLTVASGEVYGLVGYNGAGKTTLLKCIAGIYRADSGRVLIDGILAERARPGTLFIVADEPYFMPQATPAQMEKHYRGYYPAWDSTLFSTLLEIFGLSATSRIEGFSKGMQRQCGIALGLASGAAALLLDESFDGLDLSKRNLIKRLLAAYARERQASVVITSHNLTEIEDVASSLGMIDGHHLVFTGSIAEVHQRFPGKSLEEIFLDTGEHKEVEVDALFYRQNRFFVRRKPGFFLGFRSPAQPGVPYPVGRRGDLRSPAQTGESYPVERWGDLRSPARAPGLAPSLARAAAPVPAQTPALAPLAGHPLASLNDFFSDSQHTHSCLCRR